MTALLRKKYAGIPLYLLGESMGGAVVLSSLATTPLDVDGTVLVAPAVWARSTMPYYQRFALWIGAHTFPGTQLTGEGLDIKPSDNTDMLQALGRDDLVIKATRIDVLYGISNLMDSAALASSGAHGNILFLYGKHDDIIPAEPTCQLFEKLSANGTSQLSAVYLRAGLPYAYPRPAGSDGVGRHRHMDRAIREIRDSRQRNAKLLRQAKRD